MNKKQNPLVRVLVVALILVMSIPSFQVNAEGNLLDASRIASEAISHDIDTQENADLDSRTDVNYNKYYQLLEGNYMGAELKEQFTAWYGEYTKEELEKNYVEIFGIPENEIDEGLLEILLHEGEKFNDEFMVPASVLATESSRLEFMREKQAAYELTYDDAPLEIAPLEATPIINDLLGSNEFTNDNTTDAVRAAISENPINEIGTPAIMNATSYPTSASNSGFTSISLVNKTATSVTVDIWYANNNDGNNIFKYYDAYTKTWINLLGRDGKPQATSQRYTLNNLKAGLVYKFTVTTWDWNSSSWKDSTISVQTTPNAISFSVVDTTPTSITMSVSYASDYAWGNRLRYWNAIENVWENAGYFTDYYAQSGTYTISNLIPNNEVHIVFAHNDGTWHTTDYYITTDDIEEILVTSETNNLKFSLEQIDIDRFGTNVYNNWKSQMNTVYNNLSTLVGTTPYSGAKIEIKSDRSLINYWALSGNPIRVNQLYIPNMAYRIRHDGDWAFGVMHELGHDFDSSRWTFDSEFFANFKMAYAIEQNNATVYAGYIDYYTGINEITNYYKSESNISYDQTIANGVYSHDGLTYTFLKIKQRIGWVPFQKTFAYFNKMAPSEVPTTKLGKLNVFLSKLKDYSGVDVFSLLTYDEWQVYDSYFGGRLDYVDTRTTLVLVPGLMGSRLYYNGSRKWEPEMWQGGSPYFECEMKPYLLSNENGNSLYSLDSTRESDEDYGALDTYQDIYLYLKDPSNFPTIDYKVKFFTYDWRLSCTENAEILERFIGADQKVVLIAHSMGGLVSSAYLAKSAANRAVVKRLISFGTPYLGAAKAVVGFESGDLMPSPITNFFMATHLKDICKNTVSAYELLPSSRYGSSVKTEFLFNGVRGAQTYSNGRAYLATREWALKANGTIKPMLANSEAFHNSLMINGQHVANAVPHTYIVGTGIETPSQSVYESNILGHSMSHSLMESGDGTVVLKSARNINTYIEVPSDTYGELAEHSGLVKNPDALAQMKAIITGVPYAPAPQQSGNSIPTKQNWVDEGSYISVVMQGVQNVEIYDSTGAPVIQENQNLYLQKENGDKERIGSIWLIDAEKLRYQYVIKPGSYSFNEIELDETTPAEVLFLTFEKQSYTSKLHYKNITDSNELVLDVSTDSCTLRDSLQEKTITPSTITDALELQRLNSDRIQ